MAALRNAGKVPGKDVLVVAMDLNPENVDAVEAGELLFDIGGHWLQGGFALVLMYDYLNGLGVPAEEANVKLSLLPLTKRYRRAVSAKTSPKACPSTTGKSAPKSSILKPRQPSS